MSERFKPGDTAYLEVEIAKEHEDGAVALVLPDGQRYLIGLGDAKALNRVVTDCGRDVEFKYIKGRTDGLAEGQKKGYDAGYEKGLNEAWSAARKICLDGESGGTSADELKEIFGFSGFYHDIMQNVSATEAIAKIKAWEESKNAIHVGDVVKCGDRIGVVTAIQNLNGIDRYIIMLDDGFQTSTVNVGCLVKTGRSIDVAGFLKQIGGAE